jgi:hypothetical protein
MFDEPIVSGCGIGAADVVSAIASTDPSATDAVSMMVANLFKTSLLRAYS